MDNTPITTVHAKKIKWAYTALTAIVVWFALVLQFCLSIPAYEALGRSLGASVGQLLSYYTILCNLLVVISLTVILIIPQSSVGRFFSRGSVLTGIVVNITVVAVVYATVLRQLSNLQGLFKLADDLLHTVDPLLFIIYWFAFVPKSDLKWKNALPWLWFPFAYLIYTLIRGEISGNYPYPFVNVAEFGYEQIIFNSLVLMFVFLGFGVLYIWIGRSLARTSKSIATS
jgi:hypothetical protein